MDIQQILDILPDAKGNAFTQIEKDNPHSIMKDYANAINEKYKSKLLAKIVDSDLSKSVVNYEFYISAPIGRGYFYKLFETTSSISSPYPLKISFFAKETQFFQCETVEEFNQQLLNIFKSQFTANLLLNLIAQVNLKELDKVF